MNETTIRHRPAKPEMGNVDEIDKNFNKLEQKRKEEQLLTHRDQRLNVNFMLLMYWLPAYFFDFYNQFPTYDGVHIFPDFLSNWGQTIILVYLFWALYIDLIPEEDKKEYKKFHNKFTQLTVVQAYIVSALYWGLIEPTWDFAGMHEHAMNLVVVMTSYFVSEVRFRKRDLPNMWLYGQLYMAYTYFAAHFGRDSIYSILTWGEKKEPSNFPLTAFELFQYAVFGGVSFLHLFMWTVDQLRWKVYERKEKKNRIQLAMQRAGS